MYCTSPYPAMAGRGLSVGGPLYPLPSMQVLLGKEADPGAGFF